MGDQRDYQKRVTTLVVRMVGVVGVVRMVRVVGVVRMVGVVKVAGVVGTLLFFWRKSVRFRGLC